MGATPPKFRANDASQIEKEKTIKTNAVLIDYRFHASL